METTNIQQQISRVLERAEALLTFIHELNPNDKSAFIETVIKNRLGKLINPSDWNNYIDDFVNSLKQQITDAKKRKELDNI